MAIFVGVFWIALTFLLPETYSPVLLRKRAEKLSKMTGKVYKSRGDVEEGPTTLGHAVKTALTRPWILLFREPIVFLLSIYMAIVYGTLYMLFAAFPIVYQQGTYCKLSRTLRNPTRPLTPIFRTRLEWRYRWSPFPRRCNRHDWQCLLQRLGQQTLHQSARRA